MSNEWHHLHGYCTDYTRRLQFSDWGLIVLSIAIDKWQFINRLDDSIWWIVQWRLLELLFSFMATGDRNGDENRTKWTKSSFRVFIVFDFSIWYSKMTLLVIYCLFWVVFSNTLRLFRFSFFCIFLIGIRLKRKVDLIVRKLLANATEICLNHFSNWIFANL